MGYLRAFYHPDWRFVSRQFLYACQIDQRAVKPGNVGEHGAGHGKTTADYRQSAAAAAEPVSDPKHTLGACILNAAQATFAVTGCNTNLGVLLLAAPLAAAHYRRADSGASLEAEIRSVCAATTRADAEAVYAAIRLMDPAGLGTAEAGDVASEPTGTLGEMMALAADRDLIAQQYACNFQQIFTEAAPLWQKLAVRWRSPEWAATGVFLHLLARHRDSHIARIHGSEQADAVSGKIALLSEDFCAANCPQEFQDRLLKLDATWKRSGISPGTTADLTVCGVFAACLEADAQKTIEHGGDPGPDM